MSEFVDGDGKPIVLIEFRHEKAGWKPCNVICQCEKYSNQYDFDWCEKSKVLCFHNSGSGPRDGTVTLYPFVSPEDLPGRVWHAPSIKLVDHEGKELDDESLKAMGYTRLKRRPENPFDGLGVEDESTEYCTICESRFPTNSLCQHVKWDDINGEYTGCGSSELNTAEVHCSLFALLEVMPDEFIEDAIGRMRKKKFECGLWDGDELRCGERWNYATIDMGPLYAEHKGHDRYEPAVHWLTTLDHESIEANALTMGWFWQFKRERWSSHCVVGNMTFIRELPDDDMEMWLAQDPFGGRLPVLKVKRRFKGSCANDIQFMENPKGTRHVILWPKGDKTCGLKLSVAECHVGVSTVDIVFGRILERNGVHISKMDGYEICKFG